MLPISVSSAGTRVAAAALALAIVGVGTAAAAGVSPSPTGSSGQGVSAVDDTTSPPTTTPQTTTPGTNVPETTTAETEVPETTAPPETVAVTCETARNHGQWVSYVARTATGDTRSEQVRAAAQSDCGKKVKATSSPTTDPSKSGKSKGSANRSAKSNGRN